MGCTHYPLLKEVIFKNTQHIVLIDSASSVANDTYKKLEKYSLLNRQERPGELNCYVTDLPMRFKELGNIFLGENIEHLHLINDF